MKKIGKIMVVLMCFIMVSTVFSMTASVSATEEKPESSARMDMMDVGPHIRTYSGITRGYHFTAPCDFVITGVRVPTDATTDILQSAAVMRVKQPASTWTWPSTTNNFDLLGLWRVQSYDMIPCNIPVLQGEIIMIIGCRGTGSINSYGNVQHQTKIGDFDVTLYRSGFQQNLYIYTPNSLWTENSNIGRIFMYYELQGGIESDVRMEPQSLNLDSNGNYVQVKVEGFPENPEYTPLDVDGTTVEVEGIGVDVKYGTWNNNRWIGKCDRLMVEDAIGGPGDEVEVEVRGELMDGTPFSGKAVIKAILN
jgi:hypothetical protein